MDRHSGVGFVFEITVEGTDINEKYELEEDKTEAEVKKMWLNHVRQRWGASVARNFSDKAEVRKLSQRNTEVEG